MKITKFVSLFLVLVMCFSVVLPTFAQETGKTEVSLETFREECVDEIKAKVELDENINSNVETKEVTGSGTTAEGLKYNVIDNSYVEIAGYKGSARDVEIPSTINGYPVTSIGDEAFYGCDSLTSIEIPNSVTSIGDSVFDLCSSLTSIEVSESNVNYCDIDGVLFSKDKTVLMCYPGGKTASIYTIPDSVATIGNSAFFFCDDLFRVVFGNSVTSIGDSAFSYCTALVGIEIPSSVIAIGGGVFHECNSLASIEIPSSVTSIGDSAFFSCDNLKNVRLGNRVDSIGEDAFYNCMALESISIPSSVTEISKTAFQNCDNLTICCLPASYAEQYAKNNNIPYTYTIAFNGKSVLYGAYSVEKSITNNSRLPNYVTMEGERVYMPELLGIFAQFIIDINASDTSKVFVQRNTVSFAENSYEEITGTILTKAQYVYMAQNVLEYIADNGTAPGYIQTNAGALSFETVIKLFAKIGTYVRSENKLPDSVAVEAWVKPLPTLPSEGEDNYQYLTFDDIISEAEYASTIIQITGEIPTYVTVNGQRLYRGTMLAMFVKTVIGIEQGRNAAMPVKEITVPTKVISETITNCTLTKAEYLNLAQRIANAIDTTGALPKYCTTPYGTLNMYNMIYIYATVLNSYSTYGTLPETIDAQPWGAYDFQK